MKNEVFIKFLLIFILLAVLANTNTPILEIIEWAKENDAYISNKMHIKYLSRDNRYVVAGDQIQKDEIINKVPDSLIVSRLNPLIKQFCKSNLKQYEEYTCLVTFLCTEMQNPQSFFKEYINYLPQDLSSFPRFYNDTERAILSPSIVMRKVAAYEYDSLKLYERLKEKGIITFSQLQFDKCYQLITSRVFGGKRKGKKVVLAVPVSDLYNYKPTYNTKWVYNENTRAFILKAKYPIQKGEEISVNYGRKDNSRLLKQYGFTLKNNPVGMVYDFYYRKKKVKLPNPPELINAIKSFRKKLNRPKRTKFINNEIKALTSLKRELELELQKFTTEKEEDKIEYQKAMEDKTLNLINIYRVLIEERQILTDYIKLIELILKNLRKTEIRGKSRLGFKQNISPKYLAFLHKAIGFDNT